MFISAIVTSIFKNIILEVRSKNTAVLPFLMMHFLRYCKKSVIRWIYIVTFDERNFSSVKLQTFFVHVFCSCFCFVLFLCFFVYFCWITTFGTSYRNLMCSAQRKLKVPLQMRNHVGHQLLQFSKCWHKKIELRGMFMNLYSSREFQDIFFKYFIKNSFRISVCLCQSLMYEC